MFYDLCVCASMLCLIQHYPIKEHIRFLVVEEIRRSNRGLNKKCPFQSVQTKIPYLITIIYIYTWSIAIKPAQQQLFGLGIMYLFFFLVNKWKRHRHAPLCMHAMLHTQAREFPIMCVKLGTRISTLVGVTPMTIARP